MTGKVGQFPRDQKRGLIEAEHEHPDRPERRHFPAIKSGVSLKHVGRVDAGEKRSGFPRDQKRGLIEAMQM